MYIHILYTYVHLYASIYIYIYIYIHINTWHTYNVISYTVTQHTILYYGIPAPRHPDRPPHPHPRPQTRPRPPSLWHEQLIHVM